jgi:undecaprenyl-diphosphatase
VNSPLANRCPLRNVALGVVEWFLQWVRNHGFVLFAMYRLILGAALFVFGGRLVAGS